MPIVKNISQYPSTLRSWTINKNNYSSIAGLFFILPSVTIPLASVTDFWYWINTLLKAGLIIPLHNIKKFDPQDDELLMQESQHGFSYEIDKGKYKHSLTFYPDLALQRILQSYSGTNLSVIYYDHSRNIMLSRNHDVLSGFKTDSIITQKFNFPSQGNASVSVLKIELKDHEEFNLRGYVFRPSWQPEIVDRLLASITVNAFTTSITFSVELSGTPIEDIGAGDITITDDSVGVITFNLFTVADGIYSLTGLSNTPTLGCFEILGDIYLGRTRYIVTTDIIGTIVEFEDGTDFEFEDGIVYEYNN